MTESERKRGCTSTPVQPRVMRPCLISSAATALAVFAGIAPPRLPTPISLMPAIRPSVSTRGPPELPPKITASWPNQRTSSPTDSPSRLMPPTKRVMTMASLAMMPRVTDCVRPAGQPIERTVSPTRTRSESANSAMGKGVLERRRLRSSLMTATSVMASAPTSVAGNSSRSANRQTNVAPRPAT